MLKWCEECNGGSRRRSIGKWSRRKRSSGGSKGRTKLKAESFNFAISLSQVIGTVGGWGPIATRMTSPALSSSRSPPSSPSSTPGSDPPSKKKPPTPATRSMCRKGRRGRGLNAPNPGIINAHRQVLRCLPTTMKRGKKARKKRRRNISHNANR